MKNSDGTRNYYMLSPHEISYVINNCLPTIKHYVKVMAALEGITMTQYVNKVLMEHLDGVRAKCIHSIERK